MSACPSRLELSRWEAEPEGRRPAGLASHVGNCGSCAAVFDDIASARSLLLGAEPAEISARAAHAILETLRQRQSRRWVWKLLAPALLVPATAALLLLARPALFTHGRGEPGAIAAKGGLVVETYCKRGERVFPAESGQAFLVGDRLRFAYTMDRPGYLLVFGVDDQGRIFPYYQDSALEGLYAEAGARIMLPGSVELDGHKGWERIYTVWSESQLREDVVRAAIAATLAAVDNDIRRATALDLPVEQVSLLLGRP